MRTNRVKIGIRASGSGATGLVLKAQGSGPWGPRAGFRARGPGRRPPAPGTPRFRGSNFRGSNFRGVRFRGFTLVELMVAIVIVVIMLFLINQVFFSTSKAVGEGVGLSHVLDDSRAMMQQFARDAALMVGPDGKFIDGKPSGSLQGGVLIILQKQVPATVPDANGGEKRRLVRSDQLVFIRPGHGENPMSPATTDGFTNTNYAPWVRVWYGHVRRTEADGHDTDMDPAEPDDLAASSALGVPGGPNELASEWIFGRQGLHLFEDTGATLPGLPMIHFNGGWYNTGDGITDGATGDVDHLMGYGTTLPNLIRSALFMGLSDSALFSYEGDTPNGGMVGGREKDFIPPVPTPWHMPKQRLWSDIDAVLNNYQTNTVAEYNAYRRRAYLYTYGIKQLRINPSPEYRKDANGAPNPQYDYAAWQAAQMHPYMMARVSDFIVEFAGDYYTGNTLGGPLAPDGQVDCEDPLPPYVTGTDVKGKEYRYPGKNSSATNTGGSIRWYTHWLYANMPGATGPRPVTVKPPDVVTLDLWPHFDSDQPVTYPFEFFDPPPPPTGAYEWNTTGAVVDLPIDNGTPNAVPHAQAAFVFRHDDETIDRFPTPPYPPPAGIDARDCLWPYLIRLRWRMHDPTNRLWDPTDREAGKWFEQIIAVPRPR